MRNVVFGISFWKREQDFFYILSWVSIGGDKGRAGWGGGGIGGAWGGDEETVGRQSGVGV